MYSGGVCVVDFIIIGGAAVVVVVDVDDKVVALFIVVGVEIACCKNGNMSGNSTRMSSNANIAMNILFFFVVVDFVSFMCTL